MQLGLKVNLVNFPKAARPSKEGVIHLAFFRMENFWEQQQNLGEKCWKLLGTAVSMQFQTPFRSSSNLHIWDKAFVKLHLSVAIWESFARKQTLPFREGEHTSIQSIPTACLSDNKTSKRTKGDQKEHQKLIISLWFSYVHFSCTFLSNKFMHVFTETKSLMEIPPLREDADRKSL